MPAEADRRPPIDESRNPSNSDRPEDCGVGRRSPLTGFNECGVTDLALKDRILPFNSRQIGKNKAIAVGDIAMDANDSAKFDFRAARWGETRHTRSVLFW